MNRGDGTFSPGVDYSGGADAVAVDDLNGDGRADRVTAFKNTVSVLLNRRDGTFLRPSTYTTGRGATGVYEAWRSAT
jgi:FG-GAP-like repeat